MAETQNIPHLDLKFYNSSAVLPGTVNNNANAITLAFDKENNRIGLNNTWFGGKFLPLTGGIVTGPIILSGGTGTINVNRSDRPAISWTKRNGRDAIEIGNTSMHLRLSSGSNGNLYHYYQDSSTSYEAFILDAKNTRVSDYSIGNIQYGYTLSLPQGISDSTSNNANAANSTFNLLGIGQLNPSIEFGANDDAGKVRITVGGESTSFVDVSARYAQQASSAVGVTNLYFDVDDNNNIVTKSQGTSLVSSKNKIEVSSDLKVEKIPATDGGSITANPTSWKLKISLSDTFLQRITTLENRHDVSLTFIE